MPVSGLPLIQQGLYPPSPEGKRDAWNARMRAPQSLLLQHNDDGDQGSYREPLLRRVQREKVGGRNREL